MASGAMRQGQDAETGWVSEGGWHSAGSEMLGSGSGAGAAGAMEAGGAELEMLWTAGRQVAAAAAGPGRAGAGRPLVGLEVGVGRRRAQLATAGVAGVGGVESSRMR